MEKIINDYEYPSLLEDIKKTNYSYKEVIELWNAIDNESSTYGEFSPHDIARAIVFLINKLENSIPKSKIEEKIKELKLKIEEYNEYAKQGTETDVEYYENVANIEMVRVLEQLLESEEK